ncbi:hypothetical protein [Pseudonocardia sp. McavD-2-B]|uniref:hypothetical protein n=1 Tax=Pseudonocardia sp. McavD-2-B TaxID=2954499 RepID=UPI0020984726|nr:hypothetical protein [Pseudonocardia sp. McavD-2-B]MCO7192304.1 hypothetical protein [Pseudonocardia sp. McavD-2-B]
MTTTEPATDARGVACHCDGDDAGHVPGTRECAPIPVRASGKPARTPDPNTAAAGICDALARQTTDPDYRRRLRASAKILRAARSHK